MATNTQVLNTFISYLGEDGTRAWKHCGMSGGAWCCAEVSTVYFNAKAKSLFYGGKTVVYCPNAYQYCSVHLAKLPPYLAMGGDIIFYDWNGNNVSDHIGMVVERISCDKIKAIEGNTGSPARVRYKTRTAGYIHGIFRPSYEPATLPTKEKLTIDGKFDYASIYMLQLALGVKADAIFGRNTLKALQKKAGVTADADWGTGTSKAVQKMCGLKGSAVDGEFGVKSVKALQKWINNQVFPSSK